MLLNDLSAGSTIIVAFIEGGTGMDMNDELGILREVGNIAACHGSTALSDFLDRRIILTPPVTSVISPGQRPPGLNPDNLSVTIFARLRSVIKGEVLFLLDEHNAFRLIGLSPLASEGQHSGLPVLTEMGLSTIKELGNIIIGSYLTALSVTLDRTIVPPLPTLISGSVEYIMDFIFSPCTGEKERFFIDTALAVPSENMNGRICLILSPDSFREIRSICLKALGMPDL